MNIKTKAIIELQALTQAIMSNQNNLNKRLVELEHEYAHEKKQVRDRLMVIEAECASLDVAVDVLEHNDPMGDDSYEEDRVT